jgi:intracellular sulfur oxidation DsrE/DsrF family protein
MKMQITDEILNAFVDQQLTPSEMGEVFEAVKQDAELARRSCEIRQLKSLVRHAYDGLEPNRPAQWAKPRSWGMQAAAAVLLLGLGGLLGWTLRPMGGSILPVALAQKGEFMHVSQQSATAGNHFILHIDTDKPERMAAVLDYADQILDNARKEGVQAELEIVANNYGLSLLREGYNGPFQKRIDALAAKHANLRFIACGQAVARIEREGKKVILIDEAQMVPSVIGEVVSKMKEGWTYIRV